MRRASLLGEVLALDVVERVLLERNSGVTALLRAIVNEAVLTDVKIAGARAARPFIRLASREVFLKPMKSAVALFVVAPDLAIDARFTAI